MGELDRASTLPVEMLPDAMRTLGNVTMDVALTAMVDRTDQGASDQK